MPFKTQINNTGISLDRFCFDLPTQPVTDYKILVTGATGYIGGELVPELFARGYHIKVIVRKFLPEYKKRWPNVEIVEVDVLNYSKLKKALKGVDCAYYLIHSLHLAKSFKEIDSKCAYNFRKAAQKNNLKRIIYLGSLGNPKVNLSNHLRSRIKVAEELNKGKTPVTFLRAAVIIGSGSASYKIINQLVLNCPLFIFPKWAKSKCQPIAIRDVIKYLVGSLEKKETTGKTYDIGGQNILTYGNMIKIEARILNKKRWFINSSFSFIKAYAKITSYFTSVSASLINVLLESCVNDVVCHKNDIKKLLPFQTINYSEALEKALTRESQKKIFEKKMAEELKLNNKKTKKPPAKSSGILKDIGCFIFHKPNFKTLIDFNSFSERQNYSYRIAQRLNIKATKYKVLNIHKIGVNVPAKYVFEELIKWDENSTCWPNKIARIVKRNNSVRHLEVYLFGLNKFPKWFKNSKLVKGLVPLFQLNAITIKKSPDLVESDNARYMLYKTSGGYPIGFFTMYVRSSVAYQQEKEQSQLFLIVGFNFYGKKDWPKIKLVNKIWESLHNRVTANILEKLKQLSEWRFEKFKQEY